MTILYVQAQIESEHECKKASKVCCLDLQVLYELPASTNWNFDVQWSARIPGLLSTSSFDGKVQIYNIEVRIIRNPLDYTYMAVFVIRFLEEQNEFSFISNLQQQIQVYMVACCWMIEVEHIQPLVKLLQCYESLYVFFMGPSEELQSNRVESLVQHPTSRQL